MKNYKKIFPYIPIIGIPLTFYYEYKEPNSCLPKNLFIVIISGFLQGYTSLIIFLKLIKIFYV